MLQLDLPAYQSDRNELIYFQVAGTGVN
jgi:hypothetical protein